MRYIRNLAIYYCSIMMNDRNLSRFSVCTYFSCVTISLCNFAISFQDDLVWGDNHHMPDFRDGRRRRGGQWHRGPRDDEAMWRRSKSKRQEKRDR